ncbi:MAG TPA: lysyl oxidase family protein, partial [Gemmatimonadaceae bacterium]|nr:lysyl oxidase family protein [Gemmatimonadaceae bacterium]
ASCHDHYHFRNYAHYRMVDVRTGKVWKSAKRGFCMLDTDPNPSWMGEPPSGDRNYLLCGTTKSPGFQGVAHGWADTYHFTLGGQYFVLDGGDGQEPVPPGDYYIEITVNPPYAPAKGKRAGCPLATDPKTGMCHQFAESNYANNTSRAYITIPSHPGKGVGPEKESPVLDYEPMKGSM